MAITINGSTGITSSEIADGTIVNADVNDVAASKLTGALPAIDGANLTGIVALPTGGSVGQVVTNTSSGAGNWQDAPAVGGLQSMQSFTASGTWTKPSGINKVKVTVTGGGGGGGSHNSDDAQGGGGAGATSIKIIDVSSVSSVTVTVGTGGAGGCGNSSNAGSPGTSSSFGSYCSAGGGNDPTTWAIGGVGGTATGGDLNIYGGDGVCGNIDGGGNEESGGTGGSSYWGSGGHGGSPWGARLDGRTYGSGGGGTHANTNNCGGDGADGVVVVEEYA